MNRLITIPPSHYCEKARWALDRAGVAYVEEGHLPMVHWLFTLPRTRTRTVPILLRDGAAPLTDSTDILRFADTALPEALRLLPAGDEEVAALEARFDEGLGMAARRLAYCHIGASPALFRRAFRDGLGASERALAHHGEAVFRLALSRAFKTSPRVRDRMAGLVRGLFDEVGDRLADGRRYLARDRFTAADLTFAALAQPVILTGTSVDELRALDPAYGDLVAELRETPAGVFIARLYADHRAERAA